MHCMKPYYSQIKLILYKTVSLSLRMFKRSTESTESVNYVTLKWQ